MSKPLYPRLLRLRNVAPNGWQRALLADGPVVLAAILILADLASAWTLLALPVAVAVMVKVHDVLAGWLARGYPAGPPPPCSPQGQSAPSNPVPVPPRSVSPSRTGLRGERSGARLVR